MRHIHLQTAVCAVALMVAGGAAAQTSTVHVIDLPSADLASALATYSRTTGLEIIADPAVTAGLRSQAVSGRMTAEVGLSRLLSGTGLRFEVRGNVALVTGRTPQGASRNEQPATRRTTTGAPSPVINVVEDVVVVGTRRSLALSRDVKRAASGVMDVVTAEDMGKFPAENVAEAIQRIPGVAISRDQGEGTTATIRGLPPALTQVLVNGDIAASGEIGREFSFDTFSADLFASVEVLKSNSADLDEGGVAGTINLKTPSPFDFPSNAGRLNLQGSYVELADAYDARGSVLFSHRSEDDRWGALLGVTYSDRSLRQDTSSGNGWSKADFDLDGDGVNEGEGVYMARTLRDYLYLEDRERLGGVAGLAWRPDDRTEVLLNAVYSQFDVDRFRTNRSYAFYDGGELVDAVVEYDTAVFATFDNVRVSTTTQTEEENSQVFSLALKGEREIADWTLSGNIAWSQANTDEPLSVVRRYEARATVAYDIRGDYHYPEVIGDPGRADGDEMSLVSTKFSSFRNKDDALSARVDLERRLSHSWLTSVRGGLKLRERTKDREATAGTSKIGAGDPMTLVAMPFPVDDYFSGEGGPDFPREILVPDPSRYDDLYFPDVIPLETDPLDTFQVRERTFAGYVMGDLDFTVFGRRARGDVGVRMVRTQQRSSGFVDEEGDVSAISQSRTYTDVLPSANLKIELTDQLALRLGAAKVMTRPPLNDISPRQEIFPNQMRVEEGNVNLDPFRAVQGDISLEYYFGHEGLLSAALFYKDIKSFTATRETFETFRGETYLFSRIINGEGGEVSGLELSYQQPLTFLPAPFDGLGVALNYTYAESSTEFPSNVTTETYPLEGLSKNTYNAIVYYERGRLGLRAAYAYRDGFLETALGAGGTPTLVDEYGQLDLSATYRLTPALTLRFEAMNVGDERLYRYSGRINHVTDYDRTGAKYFVGLSASF